MRKLTLSALLAGSAAVAACAPVAPAVTTASSACGNYGYVDVNNDGFIPGNEWNTYRTSTYSYWDSDADGRISRSEFERCYRAGGFYREAYYNPDYWTNYWTTFDANGDGYLSNEEYWSSTAWTRADRNNNGRIDSDEWVWWGS
jgi:hypothetical protein